MMADWTALKRAVMRFEWKAGWMAEKMVWMREDSMAEMMDVLKVVMRVLMRVAKMVC